MSAHHHNPASDSGVICITHNRVSSAYDNAVIGVQGEKEGAEHTTLGNKCWALEWSRCDCQSELKGYVCDKAQFPNAECSTQAQSAMFANQFHGGYWTEWWAEISQVFGMVWHAKTSD